MNLAPMRLRTQHANGSEVVRMSPSKVLVGQIAVVLVIVTSGSSQQFATRLGGAWVFWRTGRSDAITAVPIAMDDLIPLLIGGWALIVMAAVVPAIVGRR